MVQTRTLPGRILGALVVFAAATLPGFAQPSDDHKVDRGLRNALRRGSATQHVIITVKPGHRDTLREALRQHGDVIKSEHPLIDAIAVELHSVDVEALAKQPWIEALAADSEVSAKASSKKHVASMSVTAPPTQTLSNTLRETLGLPAVADADTPTGETGVGVALIDSGIAPTDDFLGRITGFYDFTQGGQPTVPYDDYGHGTHIAGLIGSSGKLTNNEYQGVAPDVKLVGFKVLDSRGRGKTSDVIKAIEYVVANRAKLNVQIINLSLGHPIYAPAKYDPLVLAVEQASAAGLIVVTSAGNFGEKKRTGEPGYTGITSPCNAPSAICVGSVMTHDTITRDDDVVAPYSSRGPTWFDGYAKPDVVAPGHRLNSDANLSAYLYNTLQLSRSRARNQQAVLQLSGTSMAAGVTSGVVALMLQAHNQSGFHRQKPLTPNLVKAMLEFSAIPLANADYLTQGAGEINAAGAIALARSINTAAKSGSWWLDVGITPSSVIDARTHAWGQRVIWRNSVLTGNLVYVNNIVWGTGIVWGSLDESNIVWGTSVFTDAANIVWGTDIVWGTNLVWTDRVIGQQDGQNIVWGTNGQNIVWGTLDDQNIVWGTVDDGGNIVWGTWDGENIVWGTTHGTQNIIRGTSTDGDSNIVWSTVAGSSTPQGR